MAAPRRDYRTLSQALLERIVRWEHASFALNQLEPYACERGGWKPGRKLKKPPKRDASEYSYGFASDGKLLIAREGQFEYLHIYDEDEVLRLQFDRSDILFMRNSGTAADQRQAERPRSRALLFFRGGRLGRVEETWPRKPTRIDRYAYDGDGRLARVSVSQPRHTDELSYDVSGQLVRVVWRHPGGQASERFRRAPKQDSLKLLLPQIAAALVEAIPRQLERAKIKKPAYCLAVSTCLEEAPYLLPPRLTVGLVADRDRRLAQGGEYMRDELWLPDSLPLFDDPRLELRDRALVKLCARANVARADDRPVIKMLRQLATTLQRRGLGDVLVCAPEFLVYAVDIGGEDPERAARRAAPTRIAARLKKLDLI